MSILSFTLASLFVFLNTTLYFYCIIFCVFDCCCAVTQESPSGRLIKIYLILPNFEYNMHLFFYQSTDICT